MFDIFMLFLAFAVVAVIVYDLYARRRLLNRVVQDVNSRILNNEALLTKITGFKDQEHRDRWNYLWYFIADRFGIYMKNDGSLTGGQAAKEILKTMRLEFGKFSIAQINFIIILVSYLRQVEDTRKSQQAELLERMKPSAN